MRTSETAENLDGSRTWGKTLELRLDRQRYDDGFYTDTTRRGLRSLKATQGKGDAEVKTNSKLGLPTVLQRFIYTYCIRATNIGKH